MDSIRDSLKKEDIVAYIELELNADMNNSLPVLLVEGINDIVLCGKIFEENVVIYESFAGKAGLDDLMEEASLSDSRVIAVRDKDYMDIKNLPERMFVYDASCMEMMLLKNEDVINGFCSVYCGVKKGGRDYLHNAMKALSPYSILRKKSEEQGLRINFDRGLGGFIQEGECFQVDELFRKVGITDEMGEACKTEAALLGTEELYDVTNGHDICRYLGCTAREGKGKNLGEERVRNILICSYRKEDFKKTKLYGSIKEYQSRYGLCFVC